MSGRTARFHGGPDASGAARWDFSTCANAAGPCPSALERIRAADPTRYPDPQGTRVRTALGALHGVDPSRIILAASASEFIQRVTAVGAMLAPGTVRVPRHAYGDYAHAAAAWRRPCRTDDATASTLVWCAEPTSPLGQDAPPPNDLGQQVVVLDAVYAPLRLRGASRWTEGPRDAVFVLHSPNKALGLTGIRGAYVVAPREAAYDLNAWQQALERAAPSWPLSAAAEAMLTAWCDPDVQDWVRATRPLLAAWTHALRELLTARGFTIVEDSVTPFFCARPPRPLSAEAMRSSDVAVRDAASFGLPGAWRVSAQPPRALQALARTLDQHLGP